MVGSLTFNFMLGSIESSIIKYLYSLNFFNKKKKVIVFFFVFFLFWFFSNT